MRKKHKFCLLLGFAGGNYYGMQFNESVNTIEDEMLKAMVKQKWILPEHLAKPWTFDFVRGSRTDRGVSAARMNVSMVLRKLFYQGIQLNERQNYFDLIIFHFFSKESNSFSIFSSTIFFLQQWMSMRRT